MHAKQQVGRGKQSKEKTGSQDSQPRAQVGKLGRAFCHGSGNDNRVRGHVADPLIQGGFHQADE